MIYNINRGKGKKAMRPDDFIPKDKISNDEEPQNLDDPNTLHRALTGKVRVKEKKKK